MRKFVSLLAILLVSLVVLVGCSGGNDEDLVGRWAWDGGASFVYTFNADGTGSRGFPGVTETFSWSTSGSQLRINRDETPRGEIRNERWDYTIDGNRLTIESRQERGTTYTYIRQ